MRAENMNFKILSVTLCVILWIEPGICLQCYQCKSHVHGDCKEKLEYGYQGELLIKSTECTVDSAKYCIKTTGVYGGVVGTQRFCSSRHMGNQCQYVTYGDHDREYRACTYTCVGEDCNSSKMNTISLVLLILSLITALFYHV